MKAFIISAIITVCICTLCILGYMRTSSVIGEMTELEARFPSKTEDGFLPEDENIAKAFSVWQENMNFLFSTSKASYVAAVTAALNNARDFYTNGSSSDYNASRSLLREALNNLMASCSLEGIV